MCKSRRQRILHFPRMPARIRDFALWLDKRLMHKVRHRNREAGRMFQTDHSRRFFGMNNDVVRHCIPIQFRIPHLLRTVLDLGNCC